MLENRKGAYLHHDKVSCNSKKQNKKKKNMSGALLIQDIKNVLQTAANKEQALDVPLIYYLSKDSHLKKGTTVGDESTPSILHGDG